jgi:N-acyl-D-amino-acid deacylase
VIARYDGLLSIHMRNESDKVIESVHEVIEIGKETKIPIEISHFKAAGKQNWGKVAQTLKLVEDAREMDIDITVDQYPYTAGSTTLTAILPPWVHIGGKEELLQRLKNRETREQIKKEIEEEGADWDNYAKASGWDGILITSVKTEPNKYLEGKTLSEIAEIKGADDPAEAAFDLIIEEETAVSMVLFFMDENDVTTVLSHPLQMVGTDSIITGKYHPRAIASYPRILSQYVREKEVLTLPEAIRKMTSLPAQKIGLEDRGLLLPGFAADITIFDTKTISDTATYVDPHQFPKGIEFVIVNGELVVEEEKHTGVLSGKVLRKTDYL